MKKIQSRQFYYATRQVDACPAVLSNSYTPASKFSSSFAATDLKPDDHALRVSLPFTRKHALFFIASLFIALSVSQAQDNRAPLPAMPMPITEEVYQRSLDYHWISKPVIESHLLDDMEDLSSWEHRGFGSLSLTTERAKDGSHSLRLTSPTLSESPGPVIGFPFGNASAVRKVNAEDWSEYNRISFWAYPTLPGFRTIAMTVVLYNEGEEQVPGPHGGRNGRHYILLKPNEWNHCVWEIAHLGRDKVTGVELQYRLQGNEPGATDTVTYDFDLLELQKVDADYYEGWEVAPGQSSDFGHRS